MERLTLKKWFEFYKPDEETTTISVKGYTQITELEGARGNKGFYLVGEAVDKLAAYEDLEEQGLLLRLPCKVGDKVWFIREISVKRELIETEVEKVISKKGRIYIQLSCNSFYETSCNSIGKTVFFSKAEAEAALEKMKGEEHE